MMLESLVFLGATAWLVLSLGPACGHAGILEMRLPMRHLSEL